MIRLYHREGCQSCKRVRRVLDGLGVSYQAINVPKLGSERHELIAMEGVDKPTVPLLMADGGPIQGEEAILAHIQDKHGGVYGDPPYALTRRITGRPFGDVVGAVREALAQEGFGVLTEIDVKATLKKKIDVDFTDYLILGACNPPLAHRALTAEPGIGVLLPCNVVVARDPDDTVVVSAVDPYKMFTVVDRAEIEPIAEEVRQKLVRALAGV